MESPAKASEKYFIFDFDSTFIQVEALEELAKISLKGHPNKKDRLKEIEAITDAGIDGSISFADGLRQRIGLLEADRNHLKKLVKRLRKKVSTSIKRNKRFFRDHAERIFIVSAGFKEFIEPIVKKYGIPPRRIYANTFEFDPKGQIAGFDTENPLSKTNGKKELMKQLNLDGEVFVIGDGYSDYVMTQGGEQVKFYAFTENVERKSAMEEADHVTPSFEEFLFLHRMPMALSYPKNRIKILLLENIHPNAEAYFKNEGYQQVELLSTSLTEDELCEKIKDVHVIGIRSKTHITKKVLKHAKKLIAVGAFCIGTNQIDLEECRRQGVAVFNAPYSNTRSVVELVIGQMIMLMRRIPERDRKMHAGVWDKSATGSNEIRGKTLGIIGYGNIGAQLSVLAEAMGLRVLFYDRVDKLALGNAQRCLTMKELLKKSDIVSLHVDGDPLNENLFGEAEFKAMKQGSILLNLARGFVVDIPSLISALDSGKLRGASIDVYPKEPKSNDEPFDSVLKDYPQVILTPHIGGSTIEAQVDIAAYVPGKITSYINTGSSFGSVNFPELQLPAQGKSHRLLHIHRNEPGILANINKVLSEHDTNITGQYLKTNEVIGYVITDIDKEYDKDVIKILKKISGTINVRVLY